ncbi:MAG: ATP-binding cassette domain-containing protein [Treponema sp.]|jgi:ABC-type lipoprotein export system ATPase subunit|nr:ATP-binding cassette domain-containing protein [Treponema sp.]
MQSLTLLGGYDKDGRPEVLEVTLNRGDILCIVGPTGAGKSRLLEDIGCLAQGDTPTGRRVLVDHQVPGEAQRFAIGNRMVAQLSQNMHFIMDISVREFILMHGESRRLDPEEALVDQILHCANQLTGEGIRGDMPLTQLSGGQSRSLMIADTALLSPSPVVLIDELENAGVDRQRALELLVGEDKILLISTHDPVLALLGDRRLCIQRGAVRELIHTTPAERRNLAFLSAINKRFLGLRERLRAGALLDFDMPAYFTEGSGTEKEAAPRVCP